MSCPSLGGATNNETARVHHASQRCSGMAAHCERAAARDTRDRISQRLTQRDRLVEPAARPAVPTIYSYREFPVAGGLMSYGADFKEPYRLGGVSAARILKGGEASQSSCPTGHQGRAGHQSKDREGAWDQCATGADFSRRRGDRIKL